MSGFTRQFEGMPVNRDSTIPRFHIESIVDPVASAAAGHPVIRNEERVQLIMPGNPNSPVERVREDHIQKWPEQYSAFKKGSTMATDGVPVEQWPFLQRGHVMLLKGMDIHTVEQCAGLSDLAVQKIGMGGLSIRENAKAYLDDVDRMQETTAALARATAAENRVVELERQVSEMRPLLDDLHNQLMSLRNTPPEVATYVPSGHMTTSQVIPSLPMPPGDIMPDLPMPVRRGPGRPRKEDAQEAA